MKQSAASNGSRRLFNVLLACLYLATAGAIVRYLATGWDYYLTPLVERPHHDAYRALRPAGDIAHGIGVAGTTYLLLLLLYSVRKRVRWFRNWGPLPHWLSVHLYLGITGPLLITLHSSFKVQGLVAVSYWSMVAVALSGVMGRYLYQQIPRNILGRELDPQELAALQTELDRRLREKAGCDQEDLSELARLATGSAADESDWRALFLLPLRNLILRRQLDRFSHGRGDPGQRARLRVLARRKVLLMRRLKLFHTVRDIFHYWHVIHKPFAILMLVIMAVHIGVAIALGYRWVF